MPKPASLNDIQNILRDVNMKLLGYIAKDRSDDDDQQASFFQKK